MKYLTRLSWGVVIYSIMFLLWTTLVIQGFNQGLAPRLFGLGVLIALALLAGRALRFHSWRDILPYSIAWVCIAAIFDTLVSVPFTGWGLFLDWNVWVGYSLIALVPLFAPMTRRAIASSESEHYGG